MRLLGQRGKEQSEITFGQGDSFEVALTHPKGADEGTVGQGGKEQSKISVGQDKSFDMALTQPLGTGGLQGGNGEKGAELNICRTGLPHAESFWVALTEPLGTGEAVGVGEGEDGETRESVCSGERKPAILV